jgi:hypothetical protein
MLFVVDGYKLQQTIDIVRVDYTSMPNFTVRGATVSKLFFLQDSLPEAVCCL